MTIKRVLLACRGEIALRFIRTAKRLNIETISVYTDEERQASFVLAADHRVRSDAANPYASPEALLAIAKNWEADAIAPGYGPLAENADFAAACGSAGLIFIGPHPDALLLAGDKVRARDLARDAGLPVIPGGAVATLEAAIVLAEEIGFPVLLKAVAGGGGRAIRLATTLQNLETAWKEVDLESRIAFGRSGIYIERYLGDDIRHVEIQIVADQSGNVFSLGDRGCSVQRRRQKLVEEAPAPSIPPALRHEISAAATAFAKAASYTSAGTVEFLLDTEARFYFIEMNGRIQVEHPVTEAITGVDIVEQMFRIANGDSLEVVGEETHRGHAIELRICAEDPHRDFRPGGGTVSACEFPAGPGVRVDAGIKTGALQPSRYDSLCAKLIIWGRDRTEAIGRARQALSETRIAGFPTNLIFHRWLLDQPDFVAGTYDLSIASTFVPNAAPTTLLRDVAIAAALQKHLAASTASSPVQANPASKWQRVNNGGVPNGWQAN